MKFKFDGNQISFVVGSVILFKWSAVTGPYGNGPLPDGVYNIKVFVHPPQASYKRDYFGWFMPLIPQFKTHRTGLGVHPDGNVPGTLGCIGITERDYLFYALVVFMLESLKKDVIVEVDIKGDTIELFP